MPVSGGPQSFEPVFDPDNCTVPPVAPIPDIPNIEDCLVRPSPDVIIDCVDPPVPLPVPGEAGASGAAGPPGPTGPAGAGGAAGAAGKQHCPQGITIEAECVLETNQTQFGCRVDVVECDATEEFPEGCCFQFQFTFQHPAQVQGPSGSDGATGSQGPTGPQGGKSAILAYYEDVGPDGPTGPSRTQAQTKAKQKVSYLGLFCTEMPQPRFEDIIILDKVDSKDLEMMIEVDARLVTFCTPMSIEVVGIACSQPITIGAEMIGGQYIRIRGLKSQQFEDARICTVWQIELRHRRCNA